MEEAVRAYHIVHHLDLADKGIAYMENYELTVNSYDFCWGGSELHTFTSAEVRKLRVEVAEPTNNIMCRGMATPLGSLKGKLAVEPV